MWRRLVHGNIYNTEGNLELKFNHSTLFVEYLRPDTSLFVLKIDNNWKERSIEFYPIPTEGYASFYRKLAAVIPYPAKARQDAQTGYIYISFEIDTLGNVKEVKLEKDLCHMCGEKVLNSVAKTLGKWVPAQIGDSKYTSRFMLPIRFEFGQFVKNTGNTAKLNNVPKAKYLEELVVVGYGGGGSDNTRSISSLTDFFRFSDLESAFKNASMAKQLDLSSQELTELPQKVTILSGLKTLNVINNRLKFLPENIHKLYKLEQLLIDKNNLSYLPEGFKKFKALSALSLTQNRFKLFPLEVTNIKTLKVLDLSDNYISEIPPEIGLMKKLEVLAIINNDITSLPEEFYKLKRLEKLFIDLSKLDKNELLKLKQKFPKLEIIDE